MMRLKAPWQFSTIQVLLLFCLQGTSCTLGSGLEETKQGIAFQANEDQEDSSTDFTDEDLTAGETMMKVTEEMEMQSARRRGLSYGSGYSYGISRRRTFGFGHPYGYSHSYSHGFGHPYGNPYAYGHHYSHGFGYPSGGGGIHYGIPYDGGRRRRFFFTQQGSEETADASSVSSGDTATAEEDAETKMTEEMGWGERRRRKYGNPYWQGSPYGYPYGRRRRKNGNPYWHGSPYGHPYGGRRRKNGNPYWHGSGQHYGNPYGSPYSDGRRRRFFLTQQEATGEMEMQSGRRRGLSYGSGYSYGISRRRTFGFSHPYGYSHGFGHPYGSPYAYGNHYSHGFGYPSGGGGMHYGIPYDGGRRRRFFFTQQGTEETADASSVSMGDTATAEEDAETKITEEMRWGERRRRKYGNPYWQGSPYGYPYGRRRRKNGNPYWHGSPYGHTYGGRRRKNGNPYWHGSGQHYGNPYGNPYSDGRRRRFFLTQQETKGDSDGFSDDSLEMLEHANEAEDIVEM